MLLDDAARRALRRANRAIHKPIHWGKRQKVREIFDQTPTHRPGLISQPLRPIAVRKIDFDPANTFNKMPRSSRNATHSVTFRAPNQSDNFSAGNAKSADLPLNQLKALPVRSTSSSIRNSSKSKVISLNQLDDCPARNTRSSTRRRLKRNLNVKCNTKGFPIV